MAIDLPGPDRPRGQARWKVKPTAFKTVRGGDGWFYLPGTYGQKKPARPKTTKGNRYTSPPPPSSLVNPVGSGNAPGTAGTGTPAAPAGPYDQYKDTAPWAIPLLQQIDRDQAAHQQYGSTVADWLGKSLAALTGVDPNQPGYNQQVQQQYLANVAGSVGGSLGAAAASVPMAPAAVGPGGVVAGNLGYAVNAGKEASAVRASTAQQLAQAQANMNNLQTNTYAQGIVRAYADMQAGLPAIYSQRRNEEIAKIDQWVAEQQQAQAELEFKMAQFAETQRHNKVSEATSALNAQTNSAIALASLGLKADDQAFSQAQDLAGASGPVPYGYVRLPDGSYRRDPSVPNATSGGGGGGGGSTSNKPLTASQISSMQGKWTRPRNSPPKLGAGWKQPVWDPGTKAWYAKRAPSSGSGSGSTGKVKGYGSLVSDLGKKWNGSSNAFGSDDGWETTFRGNPSGIAEALAGWIIENAVSFNTASGGRFDIAKAQRVIATLGDGQRKWALVGPLLRKRIKNGVLR